MAASLEPDAVVSALAREAGIHPSQLYGWRRQLCARQRATADFAAVRVAPEAMAGLPATLPATLGVIDIEFASGTRMRITGPVDAATLSAVTAALVAKDRRR